MLVVRTLYDRTKLVTEEEDKRERRTHPKHTDHMSVSTVRNKNRMAAGVAERTEANN